MQFSWFGVLLGSYSNVVSFRQSLPLVDCDRVADHVEHQGWKRLRLIRHSQCETVAASSPTRVDSSAEGVRGQFGPQDSESTPQSVQVARMHDVASLGDDSQSGMRRTVSKSRRAMRMCPIQSPAQLLRCQFPEAQS